MKTFCITYNSHFDNGKKFIAEWWGLAINKVMAKNIFLNSAKLGDLDYPYDSIVKIEEQ